MKRLIVILLVVLLLAGCGAPAPAAEDTAPELTVALVVAGTFGDRSFYDSSKAGCDKLAAEGIQVKTIECKNENHTQQIYNAADAADVVVLVGWEFYEFTMDRLYGMDLQHALPNATDGALDTMIDLILGSAGALIAMFVEAFRRVGLFGEEVYHFVEFSFLL